MVANRRPLWTGVALLAGLASGIGAASTAANELTAYRLFQRCQGAPGTYDEGRCVNFIGGFAKIGRAHV